MPVTTRFEVIPRAGLFSPEHDELRQVVRTFVDRALRPHVEEWEESGKLPVRDLLAQAGTVGLFGAKVEPEWGGTGPDLVADAVVTEEIARCGSGGVAATFRAQKDGPSVYVHRFGDDEQRRRWLGPAVAGGMIGALAVGEPGVGPDLAGMRTSAVRDAERWRVSGTKTFVTSGDVADFLVLAARVESRGAPEGVSLFVVDAGHPGVAARRVETLGWRSAHVAEVSFQDCALGPDALLGREGEGLDQLRDGAQWERLTMALASVAAAQATLDLAIAYARDRRAFGRPVAKFQVWRHRFADLATEIEAARSLTYGALRAMQSGSDAGPDVAMAKWFATDVGWRVADEALQVHGGYGYMMEFPVQRAWRDARMATIAGGTTRSLHDVIARSLGL